ncbi:lactonase family protein [Aestuariimicrobium sp. p3-SID1156]|uniref:lactonase family protein n=1 Tax=Aestuariimicrobium sp. p3-SID1156 TaxID=2916038 RepID=UPI00223AB222|nr:lactonase family protein [Aestuariimicrobium sp. p3-SID1156]MCT1459698.1 lactonase family protein [Aestuariimicrobium sp. p3-SID1156]
MNEILWVGCRSDESGEGGLVRLTVDGTTIETTGSWPLPTVGWLERRGDILIAALHLGASAVVALRLDQDGPHEVSRVEIDGADACHMALDPTGTQLAVANYTSGSVSLVGVDQDGTLSLVDALEFNGHSGADPERQDAPHAHHVAWLDEISLLVCDLGADQVRRLRVQGGSLVELSPVELPDGFGPRHLVVRPASSGVQLAICGELSSQLATVALDEDGWRAIGIFEGTRELGGLPSGIRLDRDNRLFVGQRGVNTIAWAEWHEDGTIGPVQESPTHGGEVRDLVLHPDARPVTVWSALVGRDAVVAMTESEEGLEIVAEHTVREPMALLFDGAVRALR